MDCAILVAAIALATGLGRISAFGGPPRRGSGPLFVWAIESALLFGLIVGPMILAGQWLRGRRAGLGAGEWFWLAPALLWVPVAAGANLAGNGIGLALVWVVAQGACSFAAFIRLAAPPAGAGARTECRWTDLCGYLTCIAMGPLVAFGINDALDQL